MMMMYGGPEFLATFFAGNGSNLGLAANWSGPSAADVAANSAGLAGHNLNFDFAKLTFATAKGWLYSAARIVSAKLQVEKGGEMSGNTGSTLFMPIRESQGTLFGAQQIIFDDGIIYMPQRINNVPNQQGVVTIKDDSLKWSKNNFRNDSGILDRGLMGDVFDWSPSPTGKAMILAGINDSQGGDIRQETWIVPIETFDSDGLPTFDDSTKIFVDGVGLTGTGLANGGNIPTTHPSLTLNGTPVLLVGKTPEAAGTGYVMVNTGTLNTPLYDTYLPFFNIDTRLRSPQQINFDSLGRVYLTCNAPNAPAPVGYGVYRLTYSGANNNQSDLIDAANWSVEEIGYAGNYVAPTTSGTGLTASYRGNGIVVDESSTVNGEPTIYMSDRRGNVIYRITANTPAPATGADWDFNIVVGQADTAGSTEGIGTAAQLFSPIDLHLKDNTLYIAEKFGAKIRTVDLTTLQTSTFFGIDTVRSHTYQFSF